MRAKLGLEQQFWTGLWFSIVLVPKWCVSFTRYSLLLCVCVCVFGYWVGTQFVKIGSIERFVFRVFVFMVFGWESLCLIGFTPIVQYPVSVLLYTLHLVQLKTILGLLILNWQLLSCIVIWLEFAPSKARDTTKFTIGWGGKLWFVHYNLQTQLLWTKLWTLLCM